ncbi:MAG: hypothetical protein KC643_22790 [Nitrospira sp.]|nr:hypothetical protein [Nitrospira sp.]
MMNAHDQLILEFCSPDYQPLKALLTKIPKGTLYRHVRRLVQVGWLQKTHDLYKTTEVGHRHLAEKISSPPTMNLETLYPPLQKVPTPVHQAMISLIFAGIVARQHQVRIDRHPFFLCFGETLHWKTSLGLFVCHALQLDPVKHLVDCANESGRSLSFRRNPQGQIIFKRSLLDAPFLILDEFSSADSSLRQSFNLFLSGRMVVPLENNQLTLKGVPLLTLNPKKKSSLEDRLGLSAPQIRRGILVNLDTVPMPDLTKTGESALIAAQEHPPLVFSAPTLDCKIYHHSIVRMIENILRPEVRHRFDFLAIETLCSGMTGLLPDPLSAIRQVGYAIGLLAETLDWTRAGWINALGEFSLSAQPHSSEGISSTHPSLSLSSPLNQTALSKPEEQSHRVSLQVLRLPKEIGLPNLGISDELRARLAWLAVETGRPLEEALSLLINFFVDWRGERRTLLDTLRKILELAEDLHIEAIDSNVLLEYLQNKKLLERKGWCFEDIPECLRLIELLGVVPISWSWSNLRTSFQIIVHILQHGLTMQEIDEFLTTHRQFSQLGFDRPTAKSLAMALHQAGSTGKRRDKVIQRMVKQGTQEVAFDDLQQKYRNLVVDLETLNTKHQRISHDLKLGREELQRLQNQIKHSEDEHRIVKEEHDHRSSELSVLHAFRNFLLGRVTLCDPFWAYLEALLSWKRCNGTLSDDPLTTTFSSQITERIIEFLIQIAQEVKGVGSQNSKRGNPSTL